MRTLTLMWRASECKKFCSFSTVEWPVLWETGSLGNRLSGKPAFGKTGDQEFAGGTELCAGQRKARFARESYSL